MRRDEDIKTEVLDEIDWDPQIESTDIGVTVKDGAVKLMGIASNYSEKLAAERATKRVKGVLAILDDIKLKLAGDDAVSDEEVAKRIAHVLEWNVSPHINNIQAHVHSNGFVTLTGEVKWNYEREAVKRQVARIRGVSSVSNMIKLKERVVTTDLKKKIAKALHRNADLEAAQLNVDVSGSRVTVSGNIKALNERKLIEDVIWAAPGVTHVVDKLRVV